MRKLLLVLCVAFVFSNTASAANFIWVHDASLLKYITDGAGKIWIRNVNEFDSNALGCCYNYHIDTQTVEGKLIWTMIMTLAAQNKGIWIRVPDGYAPGAITNSGQF